MCSRFVTIALPCSTTYRTIPFMSSHFTLPLLLPIWPRTAVNSVMFLHSTYADAYARLPRHEDDGQGGSSAGSPTLAATDIRSLQALDEASREDMLLDMLLCRVVVGVSHCPEKAEPDLRRPPKGCHSAAAVVTGFKVYCVYDNAQAYPEYWISYRR